MDFLDLKGFLDERNCLSNFDLLVNCNYETRNKKGVLSFSISYLDLESFQTLYIYGKGGMCTLLYILYSCHGDRLEIIVFELKN